MINGLKILFTRVGVDKFGTSRPDLYYGPVDSMGLPNSCHIGDHHLINFRAQSDKCQRKEQVLVFRLNFYLTDGVFKSYVI